MWALLALLACGGSAPEEPPAEEASESSIFGDVSTTNQLMSGPSQTVIAPAASEGAADVELRFFEVGGLHQSFFSDLDAVGALSTALGPCLDGTAQVLVAYDQERRVGRILLKAPPGGLACAPADAGQSLDLSPLRPVGVALAAYRDTVAAKYDYRVASFKIGLSFTRGAKSCDLYAAGTHPPDGTLWDPCLRCADETRCGRGSAEDGVTTLLLEDRGASRYVRECLLP